MNRGMLLRRAACGLVLALLVGCAAGPRFKTAQVDTALTPQQAAAADKSVWGRRVLWGGVIVNTENLPQLSRVEVLAYPLTSDQEPDTKATALGRFLISRRGYLESADYAPGRLVTVTGEIIGTRFGKVGEANYTYAVVQPSGLYLWPKESERGYYDNRPQIHFGIGVILH